MGNPFDRTEKMKIKRNINGLYIQRRGRHFTTNGNESKLKSGDVVFVTFLFHYKNQIIVRRKKYLERWVI